MRYHQNFRIKEMDIERFREYCLSLGEVTEKTPFGKFAARFSSILVFYVCDHMFCLIDMDSFNSVTVKSDPERIAELHATRTSCSSHSNMSARYWIQLDLGGDITDEEVLQLVRQSYDIVKAKYSRKKKK